MKFILNLIKIFIRVYTLPLSTSDIKRILVIDPNHLGDMLLSSPVYRALKDNIPTARVDALIYKFAKPGIEKNPYVSRIYELPKGSLFIQLKTILQCRNCHYDLVLQLNTSLRTNVMMYIIGKKIRVGYDYANRGCLNNVRVPISTRTARTRYRVDECVDLLEKAFGWKISNRLMIFPVTDQENEKVTKILNQYGISTVDVLIGLHPHFRRTWKNEPEWEPEKFAKLIDDIVNRYHVKIVITGIDEDREYVNRIIQTTIHPNEVVNLVSKLSFQEMGALLQRVKIFITVNTSPMHIAVAQNTPTVAMMRATPPFITFPMNNPRFHYLVGGGVKPYDPNKLDYEFGSMIHKIEINQVINKVDFLFKYLNKKVDIN